MTFSTFVTLIENTLIVCFCHADELGTCFSGTLNVSSVTKRPLVCGTWVDESARGPNPDHGMLLYSPRAEDSFTFFNGWQGEKDKD